MDMNMLVFVKQIINTVSSTVAPTKFFECTTYWNDDV